MLTHPSGISARFQTTFHFHSPNGVAASGIWTTQNWLCSPACGAGRPYVGLCPIFLVTFVINVELVQPIYLYGTTALQTEGRTTYDSNTALSLRASRGKNRSIFNKDIDKSLRLFCHYDLRCSQKFQRVYRYVLCACTFTLHGFPQCKLTQPPNRHLIYAVFQATVCRAHSLIIKPPTEARSSVVRYLR